MFDTGRYPGLQLAFDIGGSAVRAALVEDATIVPGSFRRIDHNGEVAAIYNRLTAEELVLARSFNQTVRGISIALAGNIDPDTDIVVSSPTIPSLIGQSFRNVFSQSTLLPLNAYNDANARAYGEWYFSSRPETKNFAAVFIGSGIGGGVICDGRIVTGQHGAAMEVGHIAVERVGRLCLCGGTGCVEQYASGPAILHRADALAQAEGKPPFGTVPLLLESLREGNQHAVQAYSEAGEWLSMSLTSLIHVYDPALVVLGGGVIDSTPGLFAKIIEATRNRLMPLPRRNSQFNRARLGDTGGLLGAALSSSSHFAATP
jgi:glucokinase